jgi:hypothetical protein
MSYNAVLVERSHALRAIKNGLHENKRGFVVTVSVFTG